MMSPSSFNLNPSRATALRLADAIVAKHGDAYPHAWGKPRGPD